MNSCLFCCQEEFLLFLQHFTEALNTFIRPTDITADGNNLICSGRQWARRADRRWASLFLLFLIREHRVVFIRLYQAFQQQTSIQTCECRLICSGRQWAPRADLPWALLSSWLRSAGTWFALSLHPSRGQPWCQSPVDLGTQMFDENGKEILSTYL